MHKVALWLTAHFKRGGGYTLHFWIIAYIYNTYWSTTPLWRWKWAEPILYNHHFPFLLSEGRWVSVASGVLLNWTSVLVKLRHFHTVWFTQILQPFGLYIISMFHDWILNILFCNTNTLILCTTVCFNIYSSVETETRKLLKITRGNKRLKRLDQTFETMKKMGNCHCMWKCEISSPIICFSISVYVKLGEMFDGFDLSSNIPQSDLG